MLHSRKHQNTATTDCSPQSMTMGLQTTVAVYGRGYGFILVHHDWNNNNNNNNNDLLTVFPQSGSSPVNYFT